MNHDDIIFGILGNAFHCPVPGEFEFLENALITVNADGEILGVAKPPEYSNSPMGESLILTGTFIQYCSPAQETG